MLKQTINKRRGQVGNESPLYSNKKKRKRSLRIINLILFGLGSLTIIITPISFKIKLLMILLLIGIFELLDCMISE